MDENDAVILISSDSSSAGSPVPVRRSYDLNVCNDPGLDLTSPFSPNLMQSSGRQPHSLSDSNDEDDDEYRQLNFSPGAKEKPSSGMYSPARSCSDLNFDSSPESRPKPEASVGLDISVNSGKTDRFSSLESNKRLSHTVSDASDDDPFLHCRSSQESNRLAHSLSDDSESDDILPWLKQPHTFSLASVNKSGKVADNIDPIKKNLPKVNKVNTKASAEERRNAAKAEKERKKAERLQKLMEQAETKALKRALVEAQKMYKPEECLKHMTAELDNDLFEYQFGGDLKTSLKEADVSYAVRSQIIPLSISWRRKLPDGNKEEDHVMLVLTCERITQLVQTHGLCTEIQSMQAIIPDKKISITLHGTEKYMQSQKKGKTSKSEKVSRESLMEALVEVQLFTGCCHRFVESSLELAVLISQYSKSVAEIPHRLEKSRKENDKLDWFGESDNRDCVRVDKNGLGLQRLWLQQLCEFNLAGLQMAEAITAVYPSPQALFKAYDLCASQGEGEKLLQDIPIRRDYGTLSSVRRIGPELSKKLYTFFNAADGQVELSQEDAA